MNSSVDKVYINIDLRSMHSGANDQFRANLFVSLSLIAELQGIIDEKHPDLIGLTEVWTKDLKDITLCSDMTDRKEKKGVEWCYLSRILLKLLNVRN